MGHGAAGYLISGYLCRFSYPGEHQDYRYNGSATPATLTESGAVTCHTPGDIPPGDVELRIALNGQATRDLPYIAPHISPTSPLCLNGQDTHDPRPITHHRWP